MVNVVAGVVGALLGFSGALLGAWVKNRGEQRKWLRDQKLSGAAEMISAATNIYELQSGSKHWQTAFEPSELREWQSQLQRGRSIIHLLCTQETREHANSYVQACWRARSADKEHHDKAIAALQAFTTSLRTEIGA